MHCILIWTKERKLKNFFILSLLHTTSWMRSLHVCFMVSANLNVHFHSNRTLLIGLCLTNSTTVYEALNATCASAESVVGCPGLMKASPAVLWSQLERCSSYLAHSARSITASPSLCTSFCSLSLLVLFSTCLSLPQLLIVRLELFLHSPPIVSLPLSASFVDHCPDVLFMVCSHNFLIWGSRPACAPRRQNREGVDGRRRRPTRCPDCQTSGQCVTQLPDDLDYPTLQGSYCASPSPRAAVAPEPYVSFTARSRLLCYHIIPIKGPTQTRSKPPEANHFQHLWVFLFWCFWSISCRAPSVYYRLHWLLVNGGHNVWMVRLDHSSIHFWYPLKVSGVCWSLW